MVRRPLHTFLLLCLSFCAVAQDADSLNYRTIDGKYNNLANPEWGAVGTNLRRVIPIGYTDGISTPAGQNRPNPRVISNELFAQDGLLNDPMHLSDFCWVWGQFLDHDIGLTPDGFEPAMIQVPAGDQWFDPIGQGEAIIPMMRNLFDPTTGSGIENPRQHPNILTAFIDGSNVYGSEEERAHWLRTFEGGKLKVSTGNMPPFNTVTGEYDDDIDPNAPEMDDAIGLSERLYVAGDVRANENPLLLGMHTLFVREHNRQCDLLAEAHPDWNDEQLYQHVRKIVGGILQAIVYEEYLPAMGVELPEYVGYDDQIDPGLANVFTAAAFRLGHTLLNSQLIVMDDNGEILPPGNFQLADVFFNPLAVNGAGGVDPFLKGMASQTQQSMDAKVIDDVRNFLFGPPGAGGLDLASININRGRERGLADYNTIREAFGLNKVVFFQQINSDPEVFTRLLGIYNSVDDIDAWVGMLAEERIPGTLFGPTIMKIMEFQFQTLRDGDRFYYENDPILTAEEIATIKQTTLHDVIMLNTNIELIQDNVFEAMPHGDICDNMTAEVAGVIQTESGLEVANVNVELVVNGNVLPATSDDQGIFDFGSVAACNTESLRLVKDGDDQNGITTLDLILVQKHILGVTELASPYKWVAADVNNSKTITTLDLIQIRKVVLAIDLEFPELDSWRFLPADYEFSNPDNPLQDDFPETYALGVLSQDLSETFIAIKVGDINGSASPEELPLAVEERENFGEAIEIAYQYQAVDENTYKVDFLLPKDEPLQGVQFTMDYEQGIEVEQILQGGLPNWSVNNINWMKKPKAITVSWNNDAATTNYVASGNTNIFSAVVKAEQPGAIAEFINISSRYTKSEAYDANLTPKDVVLRHPESLAQAGSFRLAQNVPNPFKASTQIGFYLEEGAQVQFSVFDALGKEYYSTVGSFSAGQHQIELTTKELGEVTGVLFYEIQVGDQTSKRKMIRLD